MPDPSIFASGVGCSVYTKYKINSHTKSYLNSVLLDRIILVKLFLASYDSSLDSDCRHFLTRTLPYESGAGIPEAIPRLFSRRESQELRSLVMT